MIIIYILVCYGSQSTAISFQYTTKQVKTAFKKNPEKFKYVWEFLRHSQDLNLSEDDVPDGCDISGIAFFLNDENYKPWDGNTNSLNEFFQKYPEDKFIYNVYNLINSECSSQPSMYYTTKDFSLENLSRKIEENEKHFIDIGLEYQIVVFNELAGQW